MKLITVVGARPNFIKVAPLMPALLAAGHDAALAHTGQHYDAAMSDIFFSDLEIPEPRWFLNVGSGARCADRQALGPRGIAAHLRGARAGVAGSAGGVSSEDGVRSTHLDW